MGYEQVSKKRRKEMKVQEEWMVGNLEMWDDDKIGVSGEERVIFLHVKTFPT